MWVVNLRNGARELRRLATDSARPLGPPIRLGGKTSSVRGITEIGGNVWVLLRLPRSSVLLRVSPQQMKVTARMPVDGGNRTFGADELTAGAGSLWVMSASGALTRWNPYDRRALRRIDVGGRGPVSFGAGSVWVARQRDGKVLKVTPKSGKVETIDVGAGAARVAARAPYAWVARTIRTDANRFEGTLIRLDTRTNRVVGEAVPIGDSPAALAVTSRDVWIADGRGTVIRVAYRP
jgi:streptogramin lyase